MAETDFEERVAAVRRFNRFYTQRIGVLGEKLLAGVFSLAEARVLYELANHETSTAVVLGKSLGLDAGYLSRILRGFRTQGLVDKKRSAVDGRQSLLRLTKRGQNAFAGLDADSRRQVSTMLASLSTSEQARLVGAMNAVEILLGSNKKNNNSYLLRSPRPGDMGWVVHRHGVLYAEEYGWDERFEALVAEIVSQFVMHQDPKRERCWMAEQDGDVVGCVFLVKQSEATAKLRLLLVEPKARGLGIGMRLVDECVRFGQASGYRKLTLWTNNVLLAARSLYERAGFRLVHEEPHKKFGRDLIGETWELKL
jgi:DNA-binding MarR family transcriptional regulator/N-acetylglutamate synthase-like GNAT family acetyltransferase